MIKISLNILSEIIKGKLIGNKDLYISEIITDSRTFVSSKKSIFFALKGLRKNGHSYIENLYERGIINFVVSDYKKEYKNLKKANFVIVNDTFKALHKLGEYHRDMFNSNILAIVGSNGKTIVKEWLYQLLNNDINIVRSPKSYNSQLGVPLSLCLLENKYNLGIIEAGISEVGEMAKLEKIIKPNVVIFTSLGEAHQENFIDLKSKATEKLKIFKNAKVLVYSLDYEQVAGVIKEKSLFLQKEVVTWSFKQKDADIYVEEVVKKETYSEIKVQYKNKSISYLIPFIDEASVKNSLSCLGYLVSQGLITDAVLQRFSKLESVEMRIQQKKAINNCILVNDYYNSDIVSFKIAIDLLKNISKNLSTTIILSDIMQTGVSDKDLYKTVSDLIIRNKIDKFIGIGKNINKYKVLFDTCIKTEFYNSTNDFLKQDLRRTFNNEIILLKGARNFRFEKISEVLELKKHRTVLEINLEAITHNFNYYKSLIPAKTKTMVMVKALSYGSGTYEIAGLLQHNGVDYLGVAFADEGVKLRKSGITTRIMVMNPDENSISDIIDYQLEPEIYSFKILDAFFNKLKNSSTKKLDVHIKIDTGMKRLGFCDFEIDELINILKNNELLHVQSVFSHLVATDEAIHDDFTKEQIKKFTEASNKISNALPYKFIKHILNTSGIERFPNAVFDMVRIGIGLYGFSVANTNKLMNVSTLKTRISQIKHVSKGESIGYGRKWIAKQDSKIAIIPIGYADGFSRQLSNGIGEVIINNQKALIVGNVCMDMCMIDITNINTKENDEVIIFGDNYTANEIAKKLNTIPYEIITGVSERVKRIYLG